MDRYCKIFLICSEMRSKWESIPTERTVDPMQIFTHPLENKNTFRSQKYVSAFMFLPGSLSEEVVTVVCVCIYPWEKWNACDFQYSTKKPQLHDIPSPKRQPHYRILIKICVCLHLKMFVSLFSHLFSYCHHIIILSLNTPLWCLLNKVYSAVFYFEFLLKPIFSPILAVTQFFFKRHETECRM